MPSNDRWDVEQACAKLLTRFYTALDDRRNDEALGAFASDAVWERMGEVLTGHSAIGPALAGRFPDSVVIHSITNLLFTATGEGTATSRALVIVYVGKAGEGGGPVTGGLRAVTEAVTDYALTSDGWRIARHSGRPLMAAG